jgi:hypothetical protein
MAINLLMIRKRTSYVREDEFNRSYPEEHESKTLGYAIVGVSSYRAFAGAARRANAFLPT